MLSPVDVSTNKLIHTDSRINRIYTRLVKPFSKKYNYVGMVYFTKFKHINIYYRREKL